MIETAESLADVERIIALDTVDGLFPGPSDLALARGRGAYAFNDADRADLRRIAKARATRASPGSCPPGPQPNASSRGRRRVLLVIATQTMTVRAGIASLIDAVRREGVAA